MKPVINDYRPWRWDTSAW